MNNTFPKNLLNNRAGMRWIGDVHGALAVDYAIDSAITENYAIGFIGDLTDQSDKDNGEMANDSAHVLRRVINLVRQGRAVNVPGNHCAKLYRYFTKLREGNGDEKTIKTSHGLEKTIEEIMTASDAEWIITGLIEIIGDAPLWHRGGRYVFVHAGAVPGMFHETPPRFRDAMRKKSGLFHRALYGQTDGTYKDGFPVRRYDWIDTLDDGDIAVIGHDIRTSVLHVPGAQGGKCIHIDTGSGKGGRLSWLDIPVEELVI